MNFYDKIKWVLGILMVFVLIITTNLLDRNNFVRVKDSVVSIYEDRLIANDLIFEISNSIKQKEIAIVTSNADFFKVANESENNNIEFSIERYEKTKLTPEERTVFDQFKANFDKLKTKESQFVQNGMEDKSNLLKLLFEIDENLHDLNKIQLNEGRRQMSISQKAIDTVELFTQIEIYLLVFLAIVVQVIVMYNPKKEKSK
ncbi:MCP four helix bundle domain-containing protein [Polaribacter gangjinensis]|uniref:Chemotaxis protein n=1 Tax=Polaribacter gangjinensis TaxID=574710 RepID=A0A2S7WDH1_9FLAO|nr:MCP four helix bundle domain-containing protein [Polaribacter gangjinensis]PQJ75647.1 chemotaxis protein [Polaribacter gangjinensis]